MAHKKMVLLPVERYQPQSSDQREENGLDVDIILSAIPKNFRTRARALLNHITADPEQRLRWNGQGELIYHGKVIPGSHITDLLKNSQRQYKHSMPMGLEEFQDGLRELNIPIGLMEKRPGPPGERLEPQKKWLTL